MSMRKRICCVAVAALTLSLTSCDVMTGIAQGLAAPMYGGYTAPASYASTSSGSTYSSSSSTSTKKSCPSCGGTGLCKTCKGTGKKYDYGSASIISKEKYVQRCGACRGNGKCGVCDGKGYV